MSRRLMLRNGSGATPILPPEYQQVEYIESGGNLYIRSPLSGFGIKGHTVHSWVGHRNTTPSALEVVMCSVGTVGGQCLFRITTGAYGTGGSAGTNAEIPADKLCEAIIDFKTSNQSGTIDGNPIFYSRYNNYQTGTLDIFGGKVYGSSAWKYYIGFIGRFQIYNTSTLETKLDFVPCYRKADGVIGMYDLVTNTFVTKTGTGTLTKGADVN